jgi:hypothetical protein
MQVHDRFHVNRDHRGTGACEVIDVQIGIRYHQVTVEREVSRASRCFDNQRPDRNVWHEVAVHYVDMDETGAAALGCFDLVAQPSEVCRKD